MSDGLFDMDPGGMFSAQLRELADDFGKYSTRVIRDMVREFVVASGKWKTGAQQRVPRKTDKLAKSLENRAGITGDEIWASLSTDVFYAVYVEFGTVRIAEGRVLALGPGAEVSDEQAVTEWKALIERGEVGSGQQMPYMRSSFNAIREEFIHDLAQIMITERGKGVA